MSEYSAQSICFVIPNFVTFSTGGAEIQIHYLTQAFLQKSWSVEVVCAGIGHEKEMVTSPYYSSQIKYHYYQKKNIRSLEFFEVLKALKKTNSAYYYQRTDFALTASTLWFAKLKNRKMIYALASDSDVVKGKYMGMMEHFLYQNNVKKVIRRTDFYLLDKLIEWAKRNADFVVCQNKQQMIDYKVNFGREGVIIPNSFLVQDHVIQEKQNIVLWVGNNNPVKRPDLFVKLANQFKEVKNWDFVMIGSAVELILGIEIPANLKVLGMLNYDETNQWFAKASVFVNTSQYEGVPNTFIQSWYFKVLILSLSVNPDEVFNNNETGFCFNGDFGALEAHFDKIVQDIINTKSIIKRGEEYFKKSFNIDENVNKLVQYIKN